MGGPVALSVGAAAAFLAWAARGRSSQIFAPSVWRGPSDRPAIALTFDDGPSRSTPLVLNALAELDVRATFFMCGVQARRHSEIARAVAAAGHEIGNHTENHARLWLRSPGSMRKEVGLAQETIERITGRKPTLFRATYGVRWVGLGRVQRELGLTGVMWTVIGRDWALGGSAVAKRLTDGAVNGAILCVHDGRELAEAPDISSTVDAIRIAVPLLRQRGYSFCTVSELIGYSNPVCPTKNSGA